jgi:hypothetical protein
MNLSDGRWPWSTWIAIAGNNDHPVARGESIESAERFRKLLGALRSRGLDIASVRNHTLGEHPACVFVKFWRQGSAIQLARAKRYALDVQVGAIQPLLPRSRRRGLEGGGATPKPTIQNQRSTFMYLNRVTLIGFTGQQPKTLATRTGKRNHSPVCRNNPALPAGFGMEGEDAMA